MSRVQLTARVLVVALTAALLLALLVLIWGLRPPLPNLTRSATGPPALTVAEQIADVIVWVLAVAVILYLLRHAARSATRIRLPGSRAAGTRLQRALAILPALEKRLPPSAHLTTARPYSLVLRAPDHVSLPTSSAPSPTAAVTPVVSDAPQPSSGRSISILGPLKVEGARQRGRKLRSLTAQMLLYLVLHPEGATVEQLADTLLPETDPDQSRNRLWQSASEAKRVLGDGFRRDDDGRYLLDRKDVDIDSDRLDRILGPSAEDDRKPEAALSLFRGEPLAGIDWVWADGYVRHLRATYVNLIEQVGRRSLEHVDPRRALELAERGLAVDRLNETLWRLAMEADSATGLRDSVSGRYAQLQELLDRELGLEPSVETRGLYLNLLSQR